MANGDSGMQTGYESVGRTIGFELFDSVDVSEMAREACGTCIDEARSVSGAVGHHAGGHQARFGVVVLFHEACGHGLEADLVGKGASVYRGRGR